MKKISSKIIISLVLATILWSGVSDLNFINTTKAESLYDINGNYLGETPENSSPVSTVPNSLSTVGTNPGTQTPQNNAVSNPQQEENHGWFMDGLLTVGGYLLDGVQKITTTVLGTILQYLILPLTNVITLIAGLLLDQSLQVAIGTDFTSIINSSVVPVWVVLRDTLNVTFIFILLWAAIKTIVGIGSSETKKMISKVIIAALLINFSLFATKIAIDAGNLLATSFLNEIDSSETVSISTRIIDGLRITSAWSSEGENIPFGSTAFFFKSLLQLILSCVAAITFFVAAILIIARTIALIFLMALSPIGFMGDVLPALKEYSKEWRENLYGQIMVAPIFLFFMLLVLKLMESSAFLNLSNGANTLVETSNLNVSLYFNYIMGIGMLFMAVKITKKFSGKIGGAFEKFGGSLAGAGLGIAMGGAAFAMRGTIGRGANALANSQKLKDASVNGNWAQRQGAKATMALGGFTSKKSFDVRNISAVSDAAKKHLGVDVKDGVFGTKFASAGKGGYAGRISEQQKLGEEKAKMLSEGIKASKFEITEERKKKETEIENKKIERNNLKDIVDRDDTQEARFKALQTEIKSYSGLNDDEYNKKIEGEIIERKKKTRLEAAANLEEGRNKLEKASNWFKGGAKEKAKKIREAIKKKDAKTQIWEAVQKASEDNQDSNSKKPEVTKTSTPSTSTPPTPKTS
jgi:hypothetical protein